MISRVEKMGREPFRMHVINRQRRIAVGDKTITVSEYRFQVVDVERTEDEATASVAR